MSEPCIVAAKQDPDFFQIPGLICWLETDSEGVITNVHAARSGRASTAVVVPVDGARGLVLVWGRALTPEEKERVAAMADLLGAPQ